MSTSEQKAREIIQAGYCGTCKRLCGGYVICGTDEYPCDYPVWEPLWGNDELFISAISKAIDDAVREEREAFARECIDEINEAFNREQPVDGVISHPYMLGCYAEAIDKLLIPRPRKRDQS